MSDARKDSASIREAKKRGRKSTGEDKIERMNRLKSSRYQSEDEVRFSIF